MLEMMIDIAKKILRLPLFYVSIQTGLIFGAIVFIASEWYNNKTDKPMHSVKSIFKNLLEGFLVAFVISTILFILLIGASQLLTKFGIIQQ